MKSLAIQLIASATTIAAMALGTTNVSGAAWLIVGNAFWWAFTIEKRAWGLAPVNVATLIVGVINFWRAS